MNVLKTATAFCLVFIVGMESRIQTDTAELISWLIARMIVRVAISFFTLVILVILVVSTTLTDCEDRFLVITDTSVTSLLSSQEMLYNYKPTLELSFLLKEPTKEIVNVGNGLLNVNSPECLVDLVLILNRFLQKSGQEEVFD